MYTNGNTNKKTTIFSPRITSPASASSSGKQGKHGTAQVQTCCFGKCVKMGSSVSQPHQQNQQATAKVEQQQERHGEQSSKNGKARKSLRIVQGLGKKQIEFQELVAEGSTARVYKGTWRGLDVAVKCIFPEYFHNNEGAVLFFTQELDTLSRQRHRSVLQLMGACLRPPDHGWLVTEFLSTTLKEWLHGRGERGEERTAPLPPFWERLAKALEIAEAMQYLHDQRPMVIIAI
ncbi:putative serine/threonine-protein kinase SIS8 [Vitis vinifera]|uniref:Putative serine/threonine-protein kinase SIS8 n=1 Tax=Vitis vinifera TaxID=29760 RepID=A0A438K7V2_VITVI|nr:putative serine/threonine-protein kinase SIS8 [Vitis vinifera]